MPATRTKLGPRAGVTLVEVVVATVVLTVGLLALAGTAGYFARSLATSAATTAAVLRARSALERRRAAPCAGAGSGVWAEPAETTVTYALAAGAGSAAVTLRTAFPCPR